MSMWGTGSTWGHTHLSAPSRPCPALGALPGCSAEPRRVGSSTPCLPFCQNLSNPSRTFLCGVDVPHVKRREGKMQVWLIFWDLDSNWGRMAKDRGALIGPATNWCQEKHFKSDIFFLFCTGIHCPEWLEACSVYPVWLENLKGLWRKQQFHVFENEPAGMLHFSIWSQRLSKCCLKMQLQAYPAALTHLTKWRQRNEQKEQNLRNITNNLNWVSVGLVGFQNLSSSCLFPHVWLLQ